MKRSLVRWSVDDLRSRMSQINFPEYQREPTVWDLEKKQRLIDSMLRGFDIASIYFYRSGEAEIDCIDGRQRINAIISFLGLNQDPQAEDNGFRFRSINEIYENASLFHDIEDRAYGDQQFEPWRSAILQYQLNIVELSNISEPEELNLLFLRLQLGSVLNAGEKLHAMTGAMRDFIFDTFGKHAFFSSISIPYRRYAHEQVAAQVAWNLFSLRDVGDFARSRYIELQLFFKRYKTLDEQDRALCDEIVNTANAIIVPFGENLRLLRNRAIAVSVFLYAHNLISEERASQLLIFGEFCRELIARLNWQLPKGLDIDPEYRDLVRFQTDITQASVERSAVARRNDFIHRYFSHFEKHREIPGDKQYRKRTGEAPGQG